MQDRSWDDGTWRPSNERSCTGSKGQWSGGTYDLVFCSSAPGIKRCFLKKFPVTVKVDRTWLSGCFSGKFPGSNWASEKVVLFFPGQNIPNRNCVPFVKPFLISVSEFFLLCFGKWNWFVQMVNKILGQNLHSWILLSICPCPNCEETSLPMKMVNNHYLLKCCQILPLVYKENQDKWTGWNVRVHLKVHHLGHFLGADPIMTKNVMYECFTLFLSHNGQFDNHNNALTAYMYMSSGLQQPMVSLYLVG